ncbi:MBL fold metallo-hydrolase [Streptococcus sp. P25B114]
MKEIYPNIYTFPIVLPNSPLREIHVYVIKSPERSVLIDTGYNHPESFEAMLAGLAELGLEMKDVDLVLTHLHADHTGLATRFYQAGAKIYAGRVDGILMNEMATGPYWDRMNDYRQLYGISRDEMAVEDNPGFKFHLSSQVPFDILEIGKYFKVGGFKFEIINLQGHTPGHIGLLDRQKQLLIGGDTVLDPITPNITFWGWDYPNILGTYLATLDKLRRTPLRLILPGHRKPIENHLERIGVLETHHFERLQEILDSISEGEKVTVRDVSARISWRIKAGSWEAFPKAQKWFASGETMAHLDYLVHTEHLTMTIEDGVAQFVKLRSNITPVD